MWGLDVNECVAATVLGWDTGLRFGSFYVTKCHWLCKNCVACILDCELLALEHPAGLPRALLSLGWARRWGPGPACHTCSRASGLGHGRWGVSLEKATPSPCPWDASWRVWTGNRFLPQLPLSRCFLLPPYGIKEMGSSTVCTREVTARGSSRRHQECWCVFMPAVRRAAKSHWHLDARVSAPHFFFHYLKRPSSAWI